MLVFVIILILIILLCSCFSQNDQKRMYEGLNDGILYENPKESRLENSLGSHDWYRFGVPFEELPEKWYVHPYPFGDPYYFNPFYHTPLNKKYREYGKTSPYRLRRTFLERPNTKV